LKGTALGAPTSAAAKIFFLPKKKWQQQIQTPGIRRLSAMLVLLFCGLLLGCSWQRSQVQDHEIERIAWLVEDLAHGRDRDLAILTGPDASEIGHRVATWLHAHDRQTHTRLPARIQDRRDRWSRLAAALQAGLIQSRLDGSLQLDPRQDEASMLRQLIKAENHDRRGLDSLLLDRCRLDLQDPRTNALLSALLTARRHLDLHPDTA
jgi:hypothetical protein